MTKPEAEPEVKLFDPSTMTFEERLARLEDLLQKIADHQINLGKSLLRLHQEHIEITADIADAGVALAAQQARTHQPGALIDAQGNELKTPPSVQLAPQIHPGPHPNRPLRGS